jgi:NAD(P)-dependent dehydrogenase (short-subunit alcohol dehydrogenase family)
MKDVIVLIGAGQIGQAIARRVGFGKHVLLADMRQDNANAAAEILGNAGYEVTVATVDASSREAVQTLAKTAAGLGDITGLIHAAGCHHRKRHRRRSSRSICMAPRYFRTAARSRGKHPAGLVSTREKAPTYAVIMGQRFRQYAQ